MINALVIVGVKFESPKESEWIEMLFPDTPRQGDIIMLNQKLKDLIEIARKKWKLDKDVPLNYVRAIGYMDKLEIPIIMIGRSPETFIVDFYYKGKSVSNIIDKKIQYKINDVVYDKRLKDNALYVNNICKMDAGYLIDLEDVPTITEE